MTNGYMNNGAASIGKRCTRAQQVIGTLRSVWQISGMLVHGWKHVTTLVLPMSPCSRIRSIGTW